MTSKARARIPLDRRLLALAGVVLLTALNMRTAVASIPPVLDELRDDLSLSATEAGILTTLPVLCFALGSPFAPGFSRRVGAEMAMLLIALTSVTGLLLRFAFEGVAALYAGTLLAAIGIALANVLVPALIKRDFPDHIGPMVGAYGMAITGSGALAAGLTVPVQDAIGGGWERALAVWSIPMAMAAALWIPIVISSRRERREVTVPRPSRDMWRQPLAWHVAVFFGMQSLAFYACLSWLPELFADHGIGRTDAGLLLMTLNLAGVPGALIVPALAARKRNQIASGVWLTGIMAIGVFGLLLAPTSVPLLWALCLGWGQGAALGLCFLFFAIRTPSPERAAQLAAMSQFVGYSIAAIGPLALGVLRDLSGGWTVPLLMLVVILVPMVWTAIGAGRERVVPE